MDILGEGVSDIGDNEPVRHLPLSKTILPTLIMPRYPVLADGIETDKAQGTAIDI